MVATRASIKWFGKDDFLPILEKHGVDLVFSGHHPLYRRYRPIGDPAMLHVTSGGGGGPVGGFVPSPLLAKGVNANHFCRVEVGPERLKLTAKNIDGEVIDVFELAQDWRGSKRAQTAPVDLAARILPLYQELLSNRTFQAEWSLQSAPQPEKTVTLKLDLDQLPRGPLDAERIPQGAVLMVSSPDNGSWKIAQQAIPLAAGRTLAIEATAPANVASVNGRVTPDAEIAIELRLGDSHFESFVTKARLVVSGEQ